MNKICPFHGFRRLGKIVIVQIVPEQEGRTERFDDQSMALHELAQEYERRLAEAEQAEDERENDWQER